MILRPEFMTKPNFMSRQELMTNMAKNAIHNQTVKAIENLSVSSRAWILRALECLITDEFSSIAGDLQMPSDESQFLKCVDRKLHDIRLKSRFVSDCFPSLRRARNLMSETEMEQPTVYLLHMMKIQEVFLPQVRKRVQITGVRHIINGGSLNMLWASAFVRMDGRSALQPPLQIRPVYLTSEALGSSNCTGSSCGTGESTTGHQSTGSLRIPTFQHWALVVGSSMPISTPVHDNKAHGSTWLVVGDPEAQMLRCELVNERRNGRILASCAVVAGHCMGPLKAIGCTSLSNSGIRKQGRIISYPIPYDQHEDDTL
jgi:hypothetical protein